MPTGPGAERYSVPYFAIPDFDAVVSCLPSCMGPDCPPKYPPLRVGDFMQDSNAKDWNKDGPIVQAQKSRLKSRNGGETSDKNDAAGRDGAWRNAGGAMSAATSGRGDDRQL